jgi:hypothetical protein
MAESAHACVKEAKALPSPIITGHCTSCTTIHYVNTRQVKLARDCKYFSFID